jgi:hypothetical protein
VSVPVLVVLPIATLLLAGCTGVVQIYLGLISEWLGPSEDPQGVQAVQGATRRDEAPASLSRPCASRSTR